MKEVVPLLNECDVKYEFGYRKKVFEHMKNSGIKKCIFKIRADTEISEEFMPDMFCSIKNIDEYCKRYEITPIYAFSIKLSDYDETPKMFVPRTEKAMKRFLSLAMKIKRDFIMLKDLEGMIEEYRNEYLIGEDLRDYSYCPYKYRPVPFREKWYRDNTTEEDEIFPNRMNLEKCIKEYDFFFSEVTSKMFLCGGKESMFFGKIKGKDIPFTVFPRLAEDDCGMVQIYPVDEVIRKTETLGKEFAEYVLSSNHVSEKVKTFNCSKIIENLY